jgi:hypothetical protein
MKHSSAKRDNLSPVSSRTVRLPSTYVSPSTKVYTSDFADRFSKKTRGPAFTKDPYGL